MTYVDTSREFRTSVFEVFAASADRFARTLRRMAEREARRAETARCRSAAASQRQSQAPPMEAPGRSASEALRMQRFL